MTQIVVAGNWSYAVVAADRRFTIGGQLVDERDDERNKLIMVATPTARLGVAFCGLAALGRFQTEPWLSALLYDALLRGGGTPDLNWMCEKATQDFRELRPAERRSSNIDPLCLWVVLAGFVSEREGAVPAYALFGNAQARGDAIEAGSFVVEVFGPMTPAQRPEQRGYAMSYGAVSVEQSEIDRLRDSVDRHEPAHAIAARSLDVIRVARRTVVGQAVIGGRFGSVVLWRKRDRQPEGWYYGERNVRTHFMPTLVTRHGIQTNRVVHRTRSDRRSSSGVRGAPQDS